MDQLNYIFPKALPTVKSAKWKMMFSEFNIVYVTQKVIKAHVLADNLAENLVHKEYHLRLIFTMKNCHLWVKIFLKCFQVGEYSLMERRIIKGKASERS